MMFVELVTEGFEHGHEGGGIVLLVVMRTFDTGHDGLGGSRIEKLAEDCMFVD